MIADLIESKARLCADDTKIYSVIRNFDDSLSLQQDLNQLMRWSNIWLLRFNAAKCKVMRIGNSSAVTYTMTDGTTKLSTVLEVVKEEKLKILVSGVPMT